MSISIVNGVNPLQTTLLELGIVSGRVALLLRSAEIQPVFGRFSMNGIAILPLLVELLLLGGHNPCIPTSMQVVRAKQSGLYIWWIGQI